MPRRVAITGLGAISGLGHNVEEFWKALSDGESCIGPLGDIGTGTKIAKGALVPNYEPAKHFSKDELPLLDRFSQFAVVASYEALCDAGLENANNALNEAALIIGTGCGGKQTDEETYFRLYKQNNQRAHPLTIPKGMPSAAAAAVSQRLSIRGPVFSVTSACASGAHAVAQGQIMIQSGLVDVAVVGGTDAPFTFGLLKGWEALRIVSNDTCRPFSKNRSGMVLGEGAAILVLESEEHVRRRGKAVYAELAGCGLSSDAGHIIRPDVNGIARAMANALNSSGLNPKNVDYVNAHGTGTPANDPIETEAIHRVFGDHAATLSISSTKSMHGHALGAASALELVATTLTVKHDLVPPTANFTTPGKGCDLDYVPNTARSQQVDVAISNSFAFGGMNAVIALRKWEDKP